MPQALPFSARKSLALKTAVARPHVQKSLVQESVKFERRTRENESHDDSWKTGENMFGNAKRDHDRWAHRVDSGTRESFDNDGESRLQKLYLERQPFPATGAFMGKCWRNPITAKLMLKKVSTDNNFQIIDLFTRSRVAGTPQELARDPYLYKPVILTLRTWIYHDFFRQKKLVASADENGMVKWVLNIPCVDAPINSGQRSSVLFYMPMVLFTAFTKDAATVATSLMALIALGVLAAMCNSAQLYSRVRLYSIPMRLCHLGVVILTVAQSTLDTMAVIGYLLTFLFIILDVANGDLAMLTSYRFWCHYAIIRELPMRCFVCRREGAAHLEELLGERAAIPTTVHGLSTWLKEYSFVVELCGALCQLERISLKEWQALLEEQHNGKPKCKYVTFGLFDKKTPSMWHFCEDFEVPKVGDAEVQVKSGPGGKPPERQETSP
ncbi:unnamed protein product [Effrenium voratum]|uniref:Uncharacterized protein n=1 Tax=Effrenium voratum TaxID=2562239 RepID=A0AA36J3V9_9DINO|nr:unnamed protein product [Effrenium voratum]